MRSRRDFLTSAAAALAYSSGVRPLRAFQSSSHSRPQRTVIVMFDGFGLDYWHRATCQPSVDGSVMGYISR